MLFRVASRLGMTVERLLAEMAADEFWQWCAYYEIEPWGFPAERINAGIVASEVANYAGRMRKRADANPSDYMPKSGAKPRRKQTAREMKQALSREGNHDG